MSKLAHSCDATMEIIERNARFPFAGTTILYPDGTDKPGERVWCANAHISNVVAAIAYSDMPGAVAAAREVCALMNADALAKAGG